ncbi:type II toxin-antitoxin system prevent-host-death family antitoxin [Rhizobium sp. NTR19]|uniref:Type II toxin-antitoxin system prevent-host-death family antitoxin n=1 Tax=Neorhizobium turbinariae TaxID=2937795 RepID=A0ABT0IUQ4_9HYPH|nr:type II toxin-antitoxin system prevent-host-death family antitoxin [Neorhizobium turbinariae]MCK8781593.1 type II toxin-antitoxin system prevent-host-death family antitoxin [Neorhizobium turbinariae]
MVMTITVNVVDANLVELLAKVEAGEDVILAKGDTPVARLTTLASAPEQDLGDAGELPKQEQERRRALIEDIRDFRRTMPKVKTDEILEWKSEGRR